MPLPLSPKLVRDKIILPTLDALAIDEHTLVQSMELLLGTAATESHMGTYLRQLGNGPALGLFQIEPNTEADVWKNYLLYRPELAKIVKGWKTFTAEEMEWNHAYSCAIARLVYRRAPEVLPKAGDRDGQARYWKKYYNTELGKGTVEKYIESWGRFVDGKL